MLLSWLHIFVYCMYIVYICNSDGNAHLYLLPTKFAVETINNDQGKKNINGRKRKNHQMQITTVI